MAFGGLALVAGMLLIVISNGRLRADPAGGCPKVWISSAKKDCAVTAPCENEGFETNCLAAYAHWESAPFPKECVSVTDWTLCDEKSMRCRKYIECVWNKEAPKNKCQKKAVQTIPAEFENATALIPGDCPGTPP